MCGITCYISSNESLIPEVSIECSIKNRGPDYYGFRDIKLTSIWNGLFTASVLHTQGTKVAKQPVYNSENDVLLWNGDIFNSTIIPETSRNLSDTEILFQWLQENDHCILKLSTLIEGPYSFVYYCSRRNELWFGRDPLGRHSLLWNMNAYNLMITSVGHKSIRGLKEVPAAGIFYIPLHKNTLTELYLHRWSHVPEFLAFDPGFPEYLNIVEDTINIFDFHLFSNEAYHPFFISEVQSLDTFQIMNILLQNSNVRYRVEAFLEILGESCRRRSTICRKMCRSCGTEECCSFDHAKLGILFSGGLDSTVIACLADKFVPPQESIDLLNVAFSQNGSFDVPDRKTGLLSLDELRCVCPDRKWNFIKINISNEELEQARKTRISNLIYPLDTILDDSLGCALWFACRGQGTLDGCCHTSSAKILLLGSGADEQLGGYTRHSNILRRNGWKDLGKQLLKETLEISRRNLGRDDRIACDSGRQPRFPFLDEQVVRYISQLPPWERRGPASFPRGLGDKLILRLVAVKLGLQNCATFPKRAFQFGCRIAKSKEKGNDKSERL